MRVSYFIGAACLALAAAAPASAVIVTFDNGAEGWEGPQGIGGATFIDTADGNPAPSLRTIFNNFGITFYNNTHPAFIGDYTQDPSVTIDIDVKSRLVDFFGTPAQRDFIVEFRDYDNPPGGYPWVSVWTYVTTLQTNENAQWEKFSVTIADTSATALPPGWGGYGAEDPDTYEPMLPPDRTFASVLAGVDELAFTTLVPGFFFGFTDFDVSLDNIGTTRVPEPGAALLLVCGALLARRR